MPGSRTRNLAVVTFMRSNLNGSSKMNQQKLIAQSSKRSLKRQKGVTMIEYALIAALVAIAALVTLTSLGTTINAKFDAVRTAISS